MRFLHQGTQALERHEFFLALSLADSAEKYAPKAADAHFLRGRIFSEIGRFDEAENAYWNALKLDPDYRGLWHNLANNEFRKREYYRAVKYYKKALELQPSAMSFRGLGRTYIELAKVDSARYAFDRAIALDSLYAPAYFNYALLWEDEGDFPKALEYAQHALRLNSESLEYTYLVGSCLVKMGEFEQAMPYLRVIVEQQPWNPGGHYNLGQALVRLGRREEAQKHLDRAEEAREQQAEIDRLQDVLKDSKNPYSYAAVGFALRRARRYNDAMHAYKAGLYLDPQNVEIRNNIAVLHLIRKDTTNAIHELEAILKQDSTLADIWINLGVLYALSKQEERARQALLTALRYDPRNERAKVNLYKLYNSMKSIE